MFQAVFLALVRHIDALTQEETLIPWLVTTAKRESWKLGRSAARAARKTVPIEDASLASESEESGLEALERQVGVRAGLDRIDARCRRLLELIFYRDPPLSYKEIATATKLPVPSIGPTRMRCLEKLARELRKAGFY